MKREREIRVMEEESDRKRERDQNKEGARGDREIERPKQNRVIEI